MSPPRIIARAKWGPRHGIGYRVPRPQSRVVFHHAPERTLPDDPTPAQVAEQIRIMEDWHAETLTPSNPRIGYQFIGVEQTGEIWEGLGWDRIGAHVGGHNTASLGILILGIDGAVTAGSDRLWRNIGALVKEGIRRGSLIARPELSPHNRYRATSCPGDVLARHVEQLTIEDLLVLTEPEPVVVVEDLPEPHVELAESVTRESGPSLELVHPLDRPVNLTARPGETTRSFVTRFGANAGEVLEPMGRLVLGQLLERVLDELERATDDVLDRVFGDGET